MKQGDQAPIDWQPPHIWNPLLNTHFPGSTHAELIRTRRSGSQYGIERSVLGTPDHYPSGDPLAPRIADHVRYRVAGPGVAAASVDVADFVFAEAPPAAAID